MSDSHHMQVDRWRMVIPRRNLSELLVALDDGMVALPEVLVPRNQRLAWHLNDQAKHKWQLELLSIVPIDTRLKSGKSDFIHYHLVELLFPEGRLPRGLLWANLSSLTSQADFCLDDREGVRAFLSEWSRATAKDDPFGRPGWFHELATWVHTVAHSRRLTWAGQFEQFHATSSFSLIRFETSPRALWFKAVGEPNTREFHITQALASHFSAYVPRVLAVRPECNGWLAEECSGQTLEEVRDIDLWRKAAQTLAQLQIESLFYTEELLRAGAYPLHSLFSHCAIERFLAVGAKLVSRNSGPGPLEATSDDLMAIEVRIRELLNRMGHLDLPQALGHLDLNSGNVVVSREQCAYLDWAEACIGPPFLTFEYLLQAFRRTFGPESPQESPVVETYLTAWKHVLSSNTIREAWACTPLLALFAYTLRCMAASEQRLDAAPKLANYLRALLRKLKRGLSNCRNAMRQVQ